ncbi:sulfatase [Primorskyibacter flagellatus]|uniref:Choline-sulfatase n=1 Tax=Primorskyibacter flagellatus TaxID=1387277 RepID=A0A1W1YUC4_9RHOB|nr:sulfatase-like hydrolase/transferase [Primorskyibacter flagellatus]SMC39805.1 choline-sulfatase [Primorskyibacter flagellatus]
MTKPPNIVVIFSDQHRADAMGCAGSAFVQTPNLDRLAAEGVRFQNAYTPWPVCTPARATMWTGVYPHAHQIIDNVYGIDNAFQSVGAVKRTVFDQLQDAGYLTAHFGKWHLGEGHPPFFDIWEESFNSRVGHWVGGRLDGQYRPTLQTDACIGFLRDQAQADSDQPFVMVQSYYPPHDPFTAPARFYEPYRHKGVPFAGYYAAVTALDHEIGRILATLESTGLRENTVVLYYSDHGETFRYRAEGEHKFVCTDDSIRIPMLISWPGTIAAGAVRSDLVGLQDLTPTLLDFAGAPPLDQCHGHSLKPLLDGIPAPDWRRGFYVQNITHVSALHQRAWLSEGWKLIASDDGNHELYNRHADPEEELNLFITPRSDPGFDRYTHYPSYRPVIETMLRDAREFAQRIDDAEGFAILEMAA